MTDLTALFDTLSLLCTAAGVVAGLLVFAVTRRAGAALALALDFWLAAGLLRLAGPPSWQRIASAAAILAIRQLVNYARRHSAIRGESPRDWLPHRRASGH